MNKENWMEKFCIGIIGMLPTPDGSGAAGGGTNSQAALEVESGRCKCDASSAVE